MVMPPKGTFQNELSFCFLDVSCNLIIMLVALVFVPKNALMLSIKKNMGEKTEHNINKDNTTQHRIDITTIDISIPGISKVMIEFLTWN